MSAFDYSKWDNIEVSDDDGDEEAIHDDLEEENEQHGTRSQTEGEAPHLADAADQEELKRRQQMAEDDEDFEHRINSLSAQEMYDQDIDLGVLAQARQLLRQQQEEDRLNALKAKQGAGGVQVHKIDGTGVRIQGNIIQALNSSSSSSSSPSPSSSPSSSSSSAMVDTTSSQSKTQSTPTSSSSSSSVPGVPPEGHPQRKAFEKIRQMVENGSAVPHRYLWLQSREEVVINVIVPPGTKGKDVVVELKQGRLIVQVKGNTVLDERLAYRIKKESHAGLGARDDVANDDDVDGDVDGDAITLPTEAVKPSTQTIDISDLWTLHDLEGDVENRRRVEIPLGKERPVGLVLWWRKVFVGAEEINLKNIKGRVKGGEAVNFANYVKKQEEEKAEYPYPQPLETSRFGPHIGEVVKNLCIAASTSSSSSSSTSSFSSSSSTSTSSSTPVPTQKLRTDNVPLSWWLRPGSVVSEDEANDMILGSRMIQDASSSSTSSSSTSTSSSTSMVASGESPAGVSSTPEAKNPMQSVWDQAHEMFRAEMKKRKPTYIDNEGNVVDPAAVEAAEEAADERALTDDEAETNVDDGDVYKANPQEDMG